MSEKRTPREWFAALRPFSFPASLLPLLVATAAALPVREWRWGILAVEAAGVLLLHGIGNLLNDYFDFRLGADTRERDDSGRPGRFLVTGRFRPEDYRNFVLVLLLLLLPAAAFLVMHGGWPVAVIAGIGLLGGYAYTGTPFRLKSRGWGEVCIFAVFGPAIAAGASWMQAGRIDRTALLLSVPVGMLVTAILASNNLRDIEEDAQAGLRTAVFQFGRRSYRWLVVGLLVLPPVILLGMALKRAVSPWVLLAWLALPAALGPARDALRFIRRPDADVRTAKYQTAFCALLLVGLMIGGSAT
jgi:1,4-dihydroxy-2-naphthoate octaprenyltransferase